MEDEISEYQVDLPMEKGRHNNQKDLDDEESTQQQNKGWLSNLHRESRVGEKEFQAQIPDLLYQNEQGRAKVFKQHKKLYEPYLNEMQTYTYRHNLGDYEVKEYLNFAKCISLKDNKSDNEGLLVGLPSSDQVEANALNFLAKCDYSIIKAKFYLLFPTLMYFNAYKSKIQKPIKLSEQEMQEKIEQFVSQLQETKLGQHEKWKQELNDLLDNRNQVAKIHQHLEAGKLLRYEIPDYIKDVFDKANKFSKELKKVMSERGTLERLEHLNKIALTEHKIITNEMLQFDQSLIRCRDWLERVEPHYEERDKINLKILSGFINEYKSLPIKCDKFEKRFKNVYEQSLDLIEKIPNFSRISKTRGTNNQERISMKDAIKILMEIQSLNIYCDEFDSFECALIINLEKVNNLQMHLNDEKQVFTIDLLKQLQSEASELNFQSQVQDQIQDLHSYYKLIEKIKKQMHDPSKLPTLLEEITKGKERGFSSQDLDSLESQIMKTIEWFKNFEKLIVEKKNITEKKFYNNFKIDQNDYQKVQLLEDMKTQSLLLKIDEKSLQEFSEILSEIQNWRDHWLKIKALPTNLVAIQIEGEQNEKMDIENENEKENQKQQINGNTNQFEQFKADSFDELLKFIQKGLTFGIQTPELLESIEYYKRGISWTISSLSYINEYFGNQIKTDLLPENIFSQLSDIFNKNKYENELYVKNKQNYEKLDIYLQFPRIPPFCYKSSQHNYLRTLKNEVELSEKEAQYIIDLDLEELQSLDHFSVVEMVPRLDEKQKKLPINNHNNKKLWQIYVLQKWGKEAQSAHKYINEEFKENRNLQELLKKEGIIEFSQIVDQLAQKLPNSDLSEFIDSCKLQWTMIDQKFSRLLDTIQKNPIRETQILVESSQDSDQWTFQRIKTLLKNGSNFTLRNEFLKLYQDIFQYIEQTENWIDSFYTKTICKRTIITKDGKKITKKKGLSLDDFNLSPLLEKRASNLESLPDNCISRQNSINVGGLDIDKIDTLISSGVKQLSVKKEQTDSEKILNEAGIKDNVSQYIQDEKIELENQDDNQPIKNGSITDKKPQWENDNNEKMEYDNIYKGTPQKLNSVTKDDIQEGDTNKEEESNMQEEKLENGNNKISVSKNGPKITKTIEESDAKVSKDVEKKLLKKSKINTFNYYLSYPMILITFYQGLIRDINNQEMIMAQNKILELIKYKVKATELLKTKPTLEEMKSYIIRGEVFNCYIPELSIMKKINKWANQWINMARKVLDSISKNKKNLNNTKVKSKDVLPIDFCEEKYILMFDPNTLCVTIAPRKKTDSNSFQQKSVDNKKKNDSGFFDGDLESQINFLNSNKNNIEQIIEMQGKKQSQQLNLQTSVRHQPGRKGSTQIFKPTGKRNMLSKNLKQNSQSSYRPKRNTQIPKHYLQGQYHFDTPKLNPDQICLSPSASQIAQNQKLTPVKMRKKEIVVEKVKRKYVRKNQINSQIEQPTLKKKRIISKDGVKTIIIEDNRVDSQMSDKKFKKSQQKQVELLEANGIGQEVQQQIAQISQLNQHSHIQVIEEDENKAYCICRGYSGEESIGCDGCQDWFHFSCIGLKPQLGNVLKKYYCMGCCKRFNRTYLAGHKTEYIWDTIEKISIEQFNEIVREGLSLPLQIKEIDQIIELKQKVDEQLEEMKTLIERGPDLLKIIEIIKIINIEKLYEKAYKLDHNLSGEQVEELRKQEEEKDRQLFQCYLAHFGFPIDFFQAEQLLLLIQRRDFARQILRHLYSNKLSLIEIFFNQVQKLFDLNKILIESSQDSFLFNHLKKIYDNSLDVKNKLSQLANQIVEFEQYQALFQQIEKEQLIIPNLKEHKLIVEDYQKWQYDAQRFISSFNNINKINKQQFEQELRSLIERYDSHILIKSKQIQTLRNIQAQVFSESLESNQPQNFMYQTNQTQFLQSQKTPSTFTPPPYSQFQIQLNKEKQMRHQLNVDQISNLNSNQNTYNDNDEDRLNSRSSLNSVIEFNLEQQDNGTGYHSNIHTSHGNAHINLVSNEEDDDDQIKSFVEDSDEEYGEDFEDEGEGENNNNHNNNQQIYQNGSNFQNQQMDDEDEEDDDEEDEDEEQDEEDEGEEDDDNGDDEEEEEEGQEQDIQLEEGQDDIEQDYDEDQQQEGDLDEEEDEENEVENNAEEEDDDDGDDDDDDDEEEEDENEDEGEEGEELEEDYSDEENYENNPNYLQENNKNNHNEGEEMEEEDDDEYEEEGDELQDEQDGDEEEDEEQQNLSDQENQYSNGQQTQNQNIINNFESVPNEVKNCENKKINLNRDNAAIQNSTPSNKYQDVYLSPQQKPISYNGRSENNFELSHSPNENGFVGEDYLPNSINVSPNLSVGNNNIETSNNNNQ